jgi:hypothetical protein
VGNDWIFLIVLWAASIVVVLAGARQISTDQLTEWSIRFNVLIADESATTIRRQLRRARTIRWTAFVVGINLGALPSYMNVIAAERAADFANELTTQAPFIAAALGSVIAEVAFVRRPPSGRRSAGLAVRRWTDFVPVIWVRCVALCVPISLIAALVATVRYAGLDGWLWFGPAASVVALAALRADGVHHIVGAAFAMGGVATCYTLMATFAGLLGLVFALATYAVIGVWYSLAATERWNVDQARLQRA